jgi:GDPmannose 4,6-dehydratase
MVVNYREGYKMFACNGILFNHESPRRGETFVTRKITMAITNIIAGKQKKLYLGNLEAKRDWGFAPEYVECMRLVLQQDEPDDYVIGTGESHSVKEFVERAFSYAGIEIAWQASGLSEKGIVKEVESGVLSIKHGDVVVEIDPRYFRPTEVGYLLADTSKARKRLDWEPKVKFEELVKIMIDADVESTGLTPKGDGKKILQKHGICWTENRLIER